LACQPCLGNDPGRLVSIDRKTFVSRPGVSPWRASVAMSGPVKKLAVRPPPRQTRAGARAAHERPAPPRPPRRRPPLTRCQPRRPRSVNHAGRGGQEGRVAEYAPEGGPVEDHGPGVRPRVAGSPHRRGGLPRGRPGVRAPPLSLSPSPGTPLVERESEKIFAKIAQHPARSSFSRRLRKTTSS
jgi:hypothetical protein